MGVVHPIECYELSNIKDCQWLLSYKTNNETSEQLLWAFDLEKALKLHPACAST